MASECRNMFYENKKQETTEIENVYATPIVQAIQSRVVFPGEPEVSVQCMSLISKIFTPAVYRIRIPGLKTEPWMEEPEFFRFPFEDEEEESFMGGYVEVPDRAGDANASRLAMRMSDDQGTGHADGRTRDAGFCDPPFRITS
ncbi:hypothetical protein AAG570_003637 [Ranatra chinensis]|uniref:Uncharacterized protein n=1 Tax=Ranatra chinensis TaxID=642074 RepID=A0ABD0YGQ0_9HEMI